MRKEEGAGGGWVGAQKRLRVEGCERGRDERTTMPCSSIGLSDHIRSRSEQQDMGET